MLEEPIKIKGVLNVGEVAGGVSNYSSLPDKPSINNVILDGNKTSDELGLQPKGEYLTEVPSDYKTKNENDQLYQAKGDYALKNEIPDTSNFITNTVDNLVNYYKKSETYTQQEILDLIGQINTIHIERVTELPENGEENVLYLVPSEEIGETNVYEEYIFVNGEPELIGTTKIDLSNYVTTEDLNTALADYVTSTGLATILSDYALKSDIPIYYFDGDTTKQENIDMFGILYEKYLNGGPYIINMKYYIFTGITTGSGENVIFNFNQLPIINSTTVFGVTYTTLSGKGFEYNPNKKTLTLKHSGWNYVLKNDNQLVGKENTQSWTPSTDYGLVHKKYVDDSVANINVPMYVIKSLSGNITNEEDLEVLEKIYNHFTNNEPFNVSILSGKNYIPCAKVYKTSDTHFYLLFESINASDFPESVSSVLTNLHNGKRNPYVLRYNYTDKTASIFNDSVKYLTTTNTTSYNVSSSYTPAHKLYVDTAINNASIQYSTMPIADSNNVGKVIQYIGETTEDYTNGYFYICTETTENEETTYNWENLQVQNGGSGNSGDFPTYYITDNSRENPWILEDSPVGYYYFSGLINKAGTIYLKGTSENFDVLILNVKNIDIPLFYPIKYSAVNNTNNVLFTPQYLDQAYRENNNATIIVKNILTPSGLDVGLSTPEYVNKIMRTSADRTITATHTYSVLPQSSVVPTTDNQFTNKKYVDDCIKVYNIYSNDKDDVKKEKLHNYLVDISNGKLPNIYYVDVYDNTTPYKWFPLRGCYILNNQVNMRFENFYKSMSINNYGVSYITGELVTTNFKIDNEYNITTESIYFNGPNTCYILSSSSQILGMTNATAYTPTGDYNPSTKLYTDKTHYENMVGYDATKTQILKNINGTLTWVDE